MDNIEIERRFLLNEFPQVLFEQSNNIMEVVQSYLNTGNITERFSKRSVIKSNQYSVGHKFFSRTVKIGHGISRYEFKDEITEEFYENIWPLIKNNTIHKTRCIVPAYNALTWEVDNYNDRTLAIAEIELPEEHYPVIFPEWMQAVGFREITNDKSYEGRELGLPWPIQK